jgi:hypothetical protein
VTASGQPCDTVPGYAQPGLVRCHIVRSVRTWWRRTEGDTGMAGSDNGGIRAARNLSAATVAAIAAWSSYSHMAHVALACGEHPQVAYALPFSVDGMLIVATIVMVDDKQRCGRVRPMARLAFTAGVLASLAANIAAAQPSLGARAVNAWPALALLLVVEMLARPPAPEAEVPPESADLSPQRHDRRLQQPEFAQIPPQAQVSPHPEVPPRSEVPPGPQVPPHPEVPPRSEVPPDPQVPPSVRVLPHAEVPRQAQVPPQGEARHAAQVPPHREVPPSGQVPPGAELPLGGPPAPVMGRRVAGSAIVPAELPRARGAAAAADRNYAPAGSDRASKNSHRTRARRPTTVTRQLAHQIIDAEPDLPRTVIATRLGVSPRRLRAILAAPA